MIPDLLTQQALLDAAADLRPDRDPSDVLAHIIWGVIAEPGDAVGGALRAQLGVIDAVCVALGGVGLGAVSAGAVHEGRARWTPRAQFGFISSAIGTARASGVRLLLPGDEAWPDAVADLGPHAPALLWVRGDPMLLGRAWTVSIVGARASTSYGEGVARELAADLAGDGHVIVSGGAYGIDAAAHRATLAVGGRTVGVVAGGVDRAYPAGHTTLLSDIADRGVLVSEVPCGTAPTKWRFLARNRVIGALGGATVVVEAGWRSGSLNTAGHAASLGRPLGAVPGLVTSATSAGCHRLLREYDARCITSADDVRELLGRPVVSVPVETGYEHDRTRLRDALSSRVARTPFDVAQRAGMSLEQVESLLGLLSLEGHALRTDEGWKRCS